jgi:UDPglucose 6-dehydrogenase
MAERIGVIGLWHLGCVLCAAWSKLGNKVIGFDHDGSRVDQLKKGVPPLFEPQLSEAVHSGLESGRLGFSTDIKALAECDFIFLSYDTPVRDDDSSDTSILERSVEDVRGVMKHGAVLVISSQSPVGFCSFLRSKLKKTHSSLNLVYSPENLRLGEAIKCYLEPGRIILGAADRDAECKARRLFSQIRADIIGMSLESAEMVKHGINSFLATSIVFTNHIADICEATGARIDDVVRGMKSDPRIGPKAYLAPGIGFSGGTLGRDLKVLDNKNLEGTGYARLFGVVHEFNAERKFSIIRRIEKILGTCEGSAIGILGVTYKPGTSTLRRSIPLEIVDALMEKKCHVRVFDPKADYSELSVTPAFGIAAGVVDASRSADLLVLLTEWNEFKEFDWAAVPRVMRRPLFFDAKNVLDGHAMRSHGFTYYSMGR